MKKNSIANIAMYITIWCAIFCSIGVIWQSIEYLFEGVIQPSWSDTLIGAVLTTSLTIHVHNIIGRWYAKISLKLLCQETKNQNADKKEWQKNDEENH